MSVAISWANKKQLAKCVYMVGFPIFSHIYNLDQPTMYSYNQGSLSAGHSILENNQSNAFNESDLIDQDLWKQLKRVTIPMFSGDKRMYQNWKAAFMACIDKALATTEYK